MFKVECPEDVKPRINEVIKRFREQFPGRRCYISKDLNIADLQPSLFFPDMSLATFEKFCSEVSDIVWLNSDDPTADFSGTNGLSEWMDASYVDVTEGIC